MHERTPNNHHQEIHTRWQERLFNGEPPLHDRLNKLREEASEVFEVVDGLSPQEIDALPEPQRKELAKEITDLIMTALGTLSVTGYDFERLFHEKMETIYRKYNPETVNGYREQGLSLGEAIEATKAEWKANGNGNGHHANTQT